MLDEVQRLPGPEEESPALEWNRLGGMSQGGLCMRRHVVRTLGVVLPLPSFRREMGQPGFEITEHGRVGVFLNDEARGRVLNENRADAGIQTGALDDRGDLSGHVREATPSRPNFQDFPVKGHPTPVALSL